MRAEERMCSAGTPKDQNNPPPTLKKKKPQICMKASSSCLVCASACERRRTDAGPLGDGGKETMGDGCLMVFPSPRRQPRAHVQAPPRSDHTDGKTGPRDVAALS